MTPNLDSQINEARDLFDKAFRVNEISQRNKFLNDGIDKFKAIEEQKVDDKQEQKISNIKTAYSKELLKIMKPTPSVDNDLVTFTILIRLNSDLDNLFIKYPELEKKFSEFKKSLHRAPEFKRFMAQLKKRTNKQNGE